MANKFLNCAKEEQDLETALLLSRAVQMDLSKVKPEYATAVAFTDGKKVYVNSDENLSKILPNYNKDMLKWLLWHEEFHNKLLHHKRYMKFLHDFDSKTKLTFDEVNIIMDILVHDSLSKMFPEIVETAITNQAQMRDCNSLRHTFKSTTLEDMLEEYNNTKDDTKDTADKSTSSSKEKDDDATSEDKSDSKSDEDMKDGTKDTDIKAHKDGGSSKEDKTAKKENARHDEVNWDELENRNSTEFLENRDKYDIEEYLEKINLRKIKLANLTKSMNSLVTTIRERTYTLPSYAMSAMASSSKDSLIFKGRKPGRTSLYLCFDASGSMTAELKLFKHLILKSIPQALNSPCQWFSGYGESIPRIEKEYFTRGDYFKGKFKDILDVSANNGYSNDGVRTLQLALEAEKEGYSPIAVTDGGGDEAEDFEDIKKLKRTVMVSSASEWLDSCKRANPHIQIIDVSDLRGFSTEELDEIMKESEE